jgi:hypothetical protein
MNIAVMIAGPVRYIDLVIERINLLNLLNYKIDYYCFIWLDDYGDRKRVDSQDSVKSKVHYLAEARGLKDEDYNKFFNQKTEKGQPNISSVMGMFYSMDNLTNAVKSSPKSYDYVLRIRTDCIAISDNFLNLNIKKNTVVTSVNYWIPHSWVSDHIMASDIDTMYKIWNINDRKSFYKKYQKVGMNPEKYLAYIIKKNRINITTKWMRYKDYHIVYAPARNTDPTWIKKLQKTRDYSILSLFGNIDKIFTSKIKKEIEEMNEHLKTNQDNYAKPKIIRIVKRIKKLIF